MDHRGVLPGRPPGALGNEWGANLGSEVMTTVAGVLVGMFMFVGLEHRPRAADPTVIDPPLPEDPCMMSPDPGPCEGICPRFYYDPCSGTCQPFMYGCCQGNANNFETPEQCHAACPPPGDICYLPPDPGPCDAICPRYYFNPCSGECELFIYGCCEGNANNFETLEQCQATCPSGYAVPADLNDDGAVNAQDLAMLLGSWGTCPGCAADLNGDVIVDAADLALLLGAWSEPLP